MNIIKLNATDSTNTYLMELAKNTNLLDETIVVTNHQKKGRGQLDMLWQSQPFNSLTFSLFKRINEVKPPQQFAISMAVSIAIVLYLQKTTSADIAIKWPNDIMAEGKKCGGVLIENQIRGKTIKSTIIGVGINVNEVQLKNLPQATSLHRLTGKKYDLDKILNGLASEICMVLKNLDANSNSAIQLKYHQLLFKKGVLAPYKLSNGTKIMGTISGVSPTGQLEIELPDGRSLTFWNKEIEMIY